LAAESEGANRLELCGPGDGGLTPSLGVLYSVLENMKIPTHVMIRPRSGDFCYSESEYEQMIQSIREVKSSGAAGVVFGILNPD
jgi:copper homeostasis protein